MSLSNLIACTVLIMMIAASEPFAGEGPGHGPKIGDELKTESPLVLSPKDIAEFRGINNIEFIWLRIPGASKYHVLLSKDRRFKHIVHESSEIPEASCKIGDLDFGTYFFKVAAVSPDGAEGPFSDTLSFIIVPPAPARTPGLSKT